MPRQQENRFDERFGRLDFERRRKIRLKEEIVTGNKMTVMNLADWAKVNVNKIRKRWEKRRRELEEVEKKKAQREKKIKEARKRKEEKRRKAIRERRCFVCGIFRHMACHCRNRREEGSVQMPSNKFEVLKDRVM